MAKTAQEQCMQLAQGMYQCSAGYARLASEANDERLRIILKFGAEMVKTWADAMLETHLRKIAQDRAQGNAPMRMVITMPGEDGTPQTFVGEPFCPDGGKEEGENEDTPGITYPNWHVSL